MSKIFKIIINTIVYLIIGILLVYVGLKVTNKIGIYKVMTGSMESGIHAGDYIVIMNEKEYKIGDVVTYVRDGYYITHRIMKINNGKVITKGDANNVEDEEFSMNDIIGKFIYKSNLLNFVIDYKYIIAAIFIILYLIANYIDKKEAKIEIEEKEV